MNLENEIVEICGKKYRKLKTIWNGNLDWDNPLLDICHSDDWIIINGIEYEELKETSTKGGGQG